MNGEKTQSSQTEKSEGAQTKKSANTEKNITKAENQALAGNGAESAGSDAGRAGSSDEKKGKVGRRRRKTSGEVEAQKFAAKAKIEIEIASLQKKLALI